MNCGRKAGSVAVRKTYFLHTMIRPNYTKMAWPKITANSHPQYTVEMPVISTNVLSTLTTQSEPQVYYLIMTKPLQRNDDNFLIPLLTTSFRNLLTARICRIVVPVPHKLTHPYLTDDITMTLEVKHKYAHDNVTEIYAQINGQYTTILKQDTADTPWLFQEFGHIFFTLTRDNFGYIRQIIPPNSIFGILPYYPPSQS